MPTLVGLVLLLAPLLTIVHEVGGHGGACLATGGTIKEIGAYYLDCASTSETSARLVSPAGAGIDVVVGVLAGLCWRGARNPLLRTTLWIVTVDKLLLAAGYPLFSGVMNVGDFSVGADRSLGALPSPLPSFPPSPTRRFRANRSFSGKSAFRVRSGPLARPRPASRRPRSWG